MIIAIVYAFDFTYRFWSILNGRSLFQRLDMTFAKRCFTRRRNEVNLVPTHPNYMANNWLLSPSLFRRIAISNSQTIALGDKKERGVGKRVAFRNRIRVSRDPVIQLTQFELAELREGQVGGDEGDDPPGVLPRHFNQLLESQRIVAHGEVALHDRLAL